MPKIKTVEIFSGSSIHNFDVWFNEKEGFFVKKGMDITMLHRAKVIAPDIKIKSDTLEEMKENLQKMVDAYYQSIECTKRIILIRANFSEATAGEWTPPEDESHFFSNYYTQRLPEYNDKRITVARNDESMKIDIEWTVYDVVESSGLSLLELIQNNKMEWVKKPHNSSFTRKTWAELERDYIVMPYTEERLQFFINMDNGFKAMADKIVKFLVQPKDNLLSLIDNHQFSLMAPQNGNA